MDCDRAPGRANSCTFGGQWRTGVWDSALSFRNWWSKTCGLVGQWRLACVLRGGGTSLDMVDEQYFACCPTEKTCKRERSLPSFRTPQIEPRAESKKS